jgi:hypothetical protein
VITEFFEQTSILAMKAKLILFFSSFLLAFSACEPCDCDDDNCRPEMDITTFLECTLDGDSFSATRATAVSTTISTDDVLVIAYGPDNSYCEITFKDGGQYTVYSTKDGRGGIFSEIIVNEYILKDGGLITGTFEEEAEKVDGSGTLNVKVGQFVALVDIVSEDQYSTYTQ